MILRAAVILTLLMAPIVRAADAPYDAIERAYAPYMAADDPLALPMKVRSIASDPYKFWRGSKDLFFIWAKTNTADWFTDAKAFLPNHGDLHLGNIGSYASDAGWNKLAFGMVDFDDSARLPFQVELLQGLITLELTARQNNIALDETTGQRLAKTLFEAYRISVNSQRNATSLLIDAQDKTVTQMLTRASVAYQSEIDTYTQDGRFRQAVLTEKGKLKEIFRPAMHRADDFAEGLAQAIVNEPDLKKLFRFDDAKSIRAALGDVAQRTRLGSSGSQGLKKYFAILRKPLRNAETDLLIYLKQEIPSAAERSGVVARENRSPGRRVKEDMDRLTQPLPYINSWCDIGGGSYWVTFKEPWSEELDIETVTSADELIHMARIWGTVAGATHREDGRFEIILPRLNPALLEQIRQRSKLFLKQLDTDFTAFGADSRVRAHVSAVEAELKKWEQKR